MTQQIKALVQGGIEVSFELEDLHDVAGWALGFGEMCEAVEPPTLR